MLNTIKNFKDLVNYLNTAYKADTTFEQVKAMQDLMFNQQAEVEALIAKETKDTLKGYAGYLSSSDSKARYVSSTYSRLLSFLYYGGDTISYNPMAETYGQAVKRLCTTLTPEQYTAYKADIEAKKAAKEKALANPETVAEFEAFVRAKGEAALTTEQKALYDSMRADQIKAVENRAEAVKATAKPVSTEARMELKHSTHTKKNIPLFVVVMVDRVERPVYEALNQRAKKLGGYYSSYRGNGAIAGFTFENEEAAIKFMAVEEEAKTDKPDNTENKYNNLKDRAAKIIEKAEQELAKERQSNTHRRAAMAANAEARAVEQLKFGKLLDRIAEGFKAGTIKYLDKINTATELETVLNVLRMAKRAHKAALKLSYGAEYTLSIEAAEYVKVPHPVLYKNCISDIAKLSDRTGKRQAGARLITKLERLTEEGILVISSANTLEDLKEVTSGTIFGADKWVAERYKTMLAIYDRIERIGLSNLVSLRAAVRELILLETGSTLSPEMAKELKLRELERKFIGANIAGFFPTPDALAEEVVALANIQETDTVLEPSAGLGHLAEMIREKHPDSKLHTVEYVHSLAEVLTEKGFEVLNEDFLTHTVEETGKYDKIVMNPPFENLQDIDHVLHAYSLLKGNSSSNKVQDFLCFVNENGYYKQNAEGSFKSAFRPTGVNTITVVIDK